MIRLEWLVMAILVSASAARAQEIVTIYDFYSARTVVSRDGSLVGGSGSPNGAEGFLLDESGQFTELPYRVMAISGDGSVVATADHSLRIDGVDTPLPDPGPGFSSMNVLDISADGNTLGGSVAEGGLTLRAAIFERSSGTYRILDPVVPMGEFEIPIQFNVIEGISSDGATLVGMANVVFDPYDYDAVSISPEGIVTYLETLDPANGVDFSWATSASATGDVIAGNRRWPGTFEYEPWRWEAGVVTGLGMQGSANAVTANGYRIVGRFCAVDPCPSWQSESALYWTEDTGPQELAEVLTHEYGVDLGGWRLIEISDVSDDGLVLVGRARDADRNWGTFVARLPQTIEVQLPEPGFGAGLTLGALVAASFRRRASGSSR